MSHANLRDGLPFHGPKAQNFSAISSEDENEVDKGYTTWKWTPPVGPFHFQQLYPFIFMWWEEYLTQRFSIRPYHRDAGTVWA